MQFLQTINNLKPNLTQKKLISRQNRIGSVTKNRVNYDKDEKFFSQDDVSLKTRLTVNKIKDFINPDILELKKKEYNNSYRFNQKEPLEFQNKLINIRQGLMDEKIITEKDKIIYPGIDTRDQYDNWQVSSEIESKHLLNIRLHKKNTDGFKNEARVQKKLKKTQKTMFQTQTDFQAKLRQQKTEQKEFREKLRDEYVFNNPSASQQKVNAAVFRLVYEQSLNNNNEYYNFKPTLIKKVSQYQTISKHNGIWQQNLVLRNEGFGIQYIEEDQNSSTYAWSCCLNEDFDSQGCNKIQKDKNQWNYTAFNN